MSEKTDGTSWLREGVSIYQMIISALFTASVQKDAVTITHLTVNGMGRIMILSWRLPMIWKTI